jgi:amidase
MNITDLTACQLSKAIHDKQVSCVEVMQAYLQRIHAVNPSYNALVSLRSDEDCLRDAASKDILLAQGKSQGWMHGFPQAPKDLTATAGLTTTMGFRGMVNNVPAQDSVVVSRMRAAGSILIGKTNTSEFGLGSHTFNRVFGVTGNAFDVSKSAGGSSGGAAVALAKRLLPVADGSDMGGSLRNPAAWNGVYGLRPSMGRIPYGTQLGNSLAGDVFFQQLGIEGPMGRCVQDMAQLLAVQAGYDARAPLSKQKPTDFTGNLAADLKGKRVAWLGDMGRHLAIQAALAQGLECSLKQFENIGCTVEAAQLNVDLNAVWQSWLTLRGLTVAGNLATLANNPAMRKLLKPEAIWEYEQGRQYSALDIYKASVARSNLLAAFLVMFQAVDFIALPATQCMPFDNGLDWPKSVAGRPMDTYHRWMECTIYATLAGLPAVAMPAGMSDGLPFGVQIIGKPQDEWSLLQLAYAWQQCVRTDSSLPRI